MNQPETGPNPERRSNAALICFCCGLALLGLSWFLGFGAALSQIAQGQAPGAAAAALMGAGIAAVGSGLLGGLLSAVGSVWLLIQVIADQTGRDKYSSTIER